MDGYLTSTVTKNGDSEGSSREECGVENAVLVDAKRVGLQASGKVQRTCYRYAPRAARELALRWSLKAAATAE